MQFDAKNIKKFIDYYMNMNYTIDTSYQEGVCLCTEK